MCLKPTQVEKEVHVKRARMIGFTKKEIEILEKTQPILIEKYKKMICNKLKVMFPNMYTRLNNPEYHLLKEYKSCFGLAILDGNEDHLGYLAYDKYDEDLFNKDLHAKFLDFLEKYQLKYEWLTCYAVGFYFK